ncbi:hypothetical protein SAMN05443633_1188 [Chryseobacterium arachidis]|uniref:Pirin N-terminal domain-containing protein n=1 Tax=Chryseobacterium arachidis TaxID=1416778 RepID=A0A1M5KZ41_9FLAO|nr:pirin family protein [Chryseobacterium arachidis]SHG58094.1 hypothetical protein SAMN05443633_1188 [Chryseobacterium arachidis]
MRIIRASEKNTHGNRSFQVNILYPGANLGNVDTGYLTVGRIDHASFRPPGLVPMHPHQDDEIFSYIRSGEMVHTDSTGHQEHLDSSYMMLMNAGTGISHEERAVSDVEMLQIFMRPSQNSLPPQVQFSEFENIYSEDVWRLVAGYDAKAPLKLRVQTNIYDIHLLKKSSVTFPDHKIQNTYLLYCFSGSFKIGDHTITKGDSVIVDENHTLEALSDSDLVLFEIRKDAVYSETGMFSGNRFH